MPPTRRSILLQRNELRELFRFAGIDLTCADGAWAGLRTTTLNARKVSNYGPMARWVTGRDIERGGAGEMRNGQPPSFVPGTVAIEIQPRDAARVRG